MEIDVGMRLQTGAPGAIAEPGRLLIIGGDSQIGSEILRQPHLFKEGIYATTRHAKQVSGDRPFLDLAAPLADWEPPKGTRVACVLAGISRLADCEVDPVRSAFVNVTQTLDLIKRLVARGVFTLFMSTDKVFDGGRSMVSADAPTNPVSEYGRQSACVEAALRATMRSGASVAILRMTKVLAPGMPLLCGWAKWLAAGQTIEAADDMVMAPVPVDVAAVAVQCVLAHRVSSIFQLSGPRDITYADAARHIAMRVGAAKSLVRTRSAAALDLPAGATPRHTTLDGGALAAQFGITVGDPLAIIDDVILK